MNWNKPCRKGKACEKCGAPFEAKLKMSGWVWFDTCECWIEIKIETDPWFGKYYVDGD